MGSAGVKQIGRTKEKLTIYDVVYIGVFAVLITICSWISIPWTVPFTMQTFGVFMAAGILGGRKGTLAVLVYILMGAAGLPVFSGFSGGVGILFGTTGGYIIGFLFSALVMWAFETVLGTGGFVRIISMAAGLAVCYAFGTAWFILVYSKANGAVSIGTAAAWCVLPFVLPDLAKIGLAYTLVPQVRKMLKLQSP